jgi:hypothetical protein
MILFLPFHVVQKPGALKQYNPAVAKAFGISRETALNKQEGSGIQRYLHGMIKPVAIIAFKAFGYETVKFYDKRI